MGNRLQQQIPAIRLNQLYSVNFISDAQNRNSLASIFFPILIISQLSVQVEKQLIILMLFATKMKKILTTFLLCLLTHSQTCQGGQKTFESVCLEECPPNTVISGSDCLQCDITNFLVVSQDRTQCECSIQSYRVDQFSCAPCHFSCLTCTGPESNQCLTCSSDKIQSFRKMVDRTCVCQSGYLDIPNFESLLCTKCHSDCLTCTGPEDTDCLECAAGRKKDELGVCSCINFFIEDENGVCTCPSPLQVQPSGLCLNATSGCAHNEERGAKKKGAGKNIASSAVGACACMAGLVKVKGVCLSCPTNFGYNSKKGKCQCNGVKLRHNSECIVCPTGQSVNKRTGKCECAKNEFKTELDTCISCPSKMIYTEGSCQCAPNFFLNGKQCKRCTKVGQNPACMERNTGSDKAKKLSLDEIKIKKKK